MAPSQRSKQRCASDTRLDDLYDYTTAPLRRAWRQTKRASVAWTVTDDWPQDVPVTEAEIDMFEAWFGDLFDELFGNC